MVVWRIYDKDLKQFVDIGGRKRLKREAIAELRQVKKMYKKMGWRIPRLEVRKTEIKYR